MRQTLIFLAALSLSGCRPVESFQAVTMNAGLAPGLILHASARAQPFAELIGAYRDAGLVCVQEVWMDADRDRVIAALDLPKSRVYAVDTAGRHERPGLDVCTERRLKGLVECVGRDCADVPAEELAICARRECAWDVEKTFLHPAECGTCLAAMAGRSLEETVKVCTGPIGASRIYGGRNGVILASKWPLKNREWIDLPSSGANRVALLATVSLPGAGDIEVACTHITSPAAAPPSHPDFVDWEQEQTVQLRMISGRLAVRAAGRPSILIGDINAGPKLPPAISASSLEVWGRVGELGFTSPATEAVPPFCTCCDGNTLRDARSSSLIDHVLLRDPPDGLSLVPIGARQIGCEKVPIAGPGGRRIVTNLSDHCGTSVTFRVVAPRQP